MVKRLFMMLAMATAFAAGTVSAQTHTLTLSSNNSAWGTVWVESGNTLDVANGAASSMYVPIISIFADAYNQSQMIYPASMLTDLPVGVFINGLTFYALQANHQYTGANFKVYLTETTNASIPLNSYGRASFTDVSTMTLVYDGALDIDGSKQMKITFNSSSYQYNGGNLLVAVVQDQPCEESRGIQWYGIQSTGSSLSDYDYSSVADANDGELYDFLPKVTFSYNNGEVVNNHDGTYTVLDGTEVEISALANMWHHVAGWSDELGNPVEDAYYYDYVFDETFPNYSMITVTMDGDKNFTVNFGEDHYTVTLGDFVSISDDPLPAGITIMGSRSYDIFPGTEFHLSVNLPDHYHFAGWEDLYFLDPDYMANPRTVSELYGPTTFTAYYSIDSFTVNVASNNPEMGRVSIQSVDGSNVIFGNMVQQFECTSGYQYGVATDGTYIYTCSWSSDIPDGYTFHQYSWDGDSIDAFNIDGATNIRDLTTDGIYFYGGSVGETVYIMDLANRTLVGNLTFPGAQVRHISYDPVRDGFWAGNWSSLALYDREGNIILSGPENIYEYSVSATVYYRDNEEHLLLFTQAGNNLVYDYNITTNTISEEPILNVTETASTAGSSGGCFLADYNGNLYWFADAQQSPQLISIYPVINLPAESFSITIPYGSEITIATTPAGPCYELTGWNNNAEVNEEGTQTLTVTENTTIEAFFGERIYAGDTTAVEDAPFSWYEHTNLTVSSDDLTHLFPGASQYGCDSVVTLHLTIRGSEGIDDVDGVRLTLSPNPVLHGQHVALATENAEGTLQGARIAVFDAQGRCLDEQEVGATYEASLPAGVYMLRLTTADGRMTTRRLVVR